LNKQLIDNSTLEEGKGLDLNETISLRKKIADLNVFVLLHSSFISKLDEMMQYDDLLKNPDEEKALKEIA
jgi:hypothetical protein